MTEQEPQVVDLKEVLLTALLLAVCAFALFSSVLGFGFVNYDDEAYVYENPHVLAGLGRGGVKYALTTGDVGTWAPLTWLSYECDTSLLGARASSYHFTNLLLHSAAGALLFIALRLMRQSQWVAATVAILFLVHPLRVESVAWIAERKDVLCAFFWMAALGAYAWYAQQPNRKRWLLVFLCFAAGLLSKMMMVTFPLALLLLDVWPLRRVDLSLPFESKKLGCLISEKLPLFAASLAVLLISAHALRSRGAFSARGSEESFGLLRVPENYLFYLEKILWPDRLSVLYPLHPVRPMLGIIAAIALLVITWSIFKQLRKLPWLAVGWLWFLVTLTPVIGFIAFGDFTVADRYTYIPSIGICWAAVSMAEAWATHALGLRWVVTAVVGLSWATLTWAQLPNWRDSLSLFNAALRVGPHYVSYTHRGAAWLEAGNVVAALADFEAAIRLNPAYAPAYNNRGNVLSDYGRYDEAIQDFDRAIQYDPYSSEAYGNRGNALARKGEPLEALPDYEKCLKLAPEKAASYNNRAAAYFQLKRYAEAEADIQKCLQLGGQPHPGLLQALAEATNSPGNLRSVVPNSSGPTNKP